MPRRNTQNAQITRVNYEVCLANLLGRRFNFNDVASNCSEIFSSGRFERDLCLIWINIISARGHKRFLIVAISLEYWTENLYFLTHRVFFIISIKGVDAMRNHTIKLSIFIYLNYFFLIFFLIRLTTSMLFAE